MWQEIITWTNTTREADTPVGSNVKLLFLSFEIRSLSYLLYQSTKELISWKILLFMLNTTFSENTKKKWWNFKTNLICLVMKLNPINHLQSNPMKSLMLGCQVSMQHKVSWWGWFHGDVWNKVWFCQSQTSGKNNKTTSSHGTNAKNHFIFLRWMQPASSLHDPTLSRVKPNKTRVGVARCKMQHGVLCQSTQTDGELFGQATRKQQIV